MPSKTLSDYWHNITRRHEYMTKENIGVIAFCSYRWWQRERGQVCCLWFQPADAAGRDIWISIPFDQCDDVASARDIPEALAALRPRGDDER